MYSKDQTPESPRRFINKLLWGSGPLPGFKFTMWLSLLPSAVENKFLTRDEEQTYGANEWKAFRDSRDSNSKHVWPRCSCSWSSLEISQEITGESELSHPEDPQNYVLLLSNHSWSIPALKDTESKSALGRCDKSSCSKSQTPSACLLHSQDIALDQGVSKLDWAKHGFHQDLWEL